jgi:hypothetical protein
MERPFSIRHYCLVCESVFKREPGFFVGAILANVVTTELAVLAVCFFALLVLGISYARVLWWLFLVAALFPVAFYHHSWSFWLAFDHLVEGLPKKKSSDENKSVFFKARRPDSN